MDRSKQDRLKKVIHILATAPSKGNFMITHVPFDNLYLENRKTISEDKLYNDILVKDLEDHKFILVQGDNGSGKSHLIRWIKEKYIVDVNQDKEATLFISRVHNTLQDALEQLLESPIFPEEIRNSELKNIKNARSNISGEELKKTINFNFQLEIENDHKDKKIKPDLRIRKMLHAYLKNTFIRDEFLMAKNGPLERVRSKIENTEEQNVNYSESEMFLTTDFDITTKQITEHLKRRDEKAEDQVIRLAEKLSDKRTGEKLKKEIVDYLNTKVTGVIQKSMKLQTSDFKKLLLELRKALKKNGKTLTLFIEDINAFTGIDNALMEVLIASHEEEGNEDYCRLISVVGSTTDFYNNRLNDSIKERVTTNLYIKEQSILGTEEKLARFAAKYINAMNIDEQQVKQWVEDGMQNDTIPIVESKYKFSEFHCDGKTYNLFPFSSNALWNLYESMPVNARSPRLVLRDIIKELLGKWYESPENFLRVEDNFINSSISIRQWKMGIYDATNRKIDPSSSLERSALLRIWGDATPVYEKGRLGGLSQEVFDAFNIYSGIDITATDTNNPMKDANISNNVNVSGDHNIKNEASSKKGPKDDVINSSNQNTKPKKLISLENEIEKWGRGEGRLASHQEIRTLFRNTLVSAINWKIEGIPEIMVEKYVKPLTRIAIREGSKDEYELAGLVLEKNPDTVALFIALVNWRYLGEYSWDFDGGEDYYVYTMSWLELNKEDILNMVEPEEIKLEQLYLWNIASLYGLKSLFGSIDLSGNMLEIGSVLLGEKPDFTKNGIHGNEWEMLQDKVIRNRNDEKSAYEYALGLFTKNVGYGYSKDTNYIFADAILLEKQIKKLKSIEWNLNLLDLVEPENSKTASIAYNALEIIQLLKNSLNTALGEEKSKAGRYYEYFKQSLGEEITTDMASEVIKKMQEFLSFLSQDMNMNYDPEKLSLLNELTPGKLKKSIENTKIICDSKDNNAMAILSKNMLDDSNEFYSFLENYISLLDEKEDIFKAKVDMKTQENITNNSKKAENIMANYIERLQYIGGVSYE